MIKKIKKLLIRLTNQVGHLKVGVDCPYEW